ncbi:hypothetical protein NBRC116602_17580 [Hyphomicrobiales bacterium 4NK60-0047b]
MSDFKGIHRRCPLVKISTTKIGTPMNDVIIPTGMSMPGMSVFDISEAKDKITALQRHAPGKRKRWSSPKINRAI